HQRTRDSRSVADVHDDVPVPHALDYPSGSQVVVLTIAPWAGGASLGNRARIPGSSPEAAEPTPTLIGWPASQGRPPQNPRHRSGATASAGRVASRVGPYVPVTGSTSPATSQFTAGTSPANAPVQTLTW